MDFPEVMVFADVGLSFQIPRVIMDDPLEIGHGCHFDEERPFRPDDFIGPGTAGLAGEIIMGIRTENPA